MKIIKSGLVHGPYDGSPYNVGVQEDGEVIVWANTGSRVKRAVTKAGTFFFLSSSNWTRFVVVPAEELVRCMGTIFIPETTQPVNKKIKSKGFQRDYIHISPKGDVSLVSRGDLGLSKMELDGNFTTGKTRMKSAVDLPDGSTIAWNRDVYQVSGETPIFWRASSQHE